MRTRVGLGITAGFAIALAAALLLVQHRAPSEIESISDNRRDEPPLETSSEPEENATPGIAPLQIIHFDFDVDHDGRDGPDFERDLEAFGLAHPERPDLARIVSCRIARRALARVERAYHGDPRPVEGDTHERGHRVDPAREAVRFVLSPVVAELEESTTRICVGGTDPSGQHSIGLVRFDPGNANRKSIECARLPPSGIFPRELTRYAEEPLFREVFGPLLEKDGRHAIGGNPADTRILVSEDAPSVDSRRARQIARAIAVFGDALGTILAHESAHALGLVPSPDAAPAGRLARRNPAFAHNRIEDRPASAKRFLMDPGETFDLAALAGVDENGRRGPELGFRPEHLAFLHGRAANSPSPTSRASGADAMSEAATADASRSPDRSERSLRDPRRSPCS